ncbi:hypothetical protein [Jiangella asiatica]|uniref:HPr kinase/phosphorylase C-terminal domain-containing protein n=1 Tax=Jiangella asiatica TaxID=2530372 RepID=A0A4R5D2G9_9ACTN|nr:hypothetical protein [Jiangella asiatica]TDE07479.1 hypothetical protein E1269_19795 [Jiangella asiatica]
MTLERQFLYGLSVASEVPLYQERPALAEGRPDVVIRWGRPVPRRDEPPAGQMLAHLELDQPYYTFTRTGDDGYRLRFYRTCDFVVEPGLRTVRVELVAGADPGIAGILTAGALLSFLLTVRGEVVLHASAVQVGDGAVAFVGRSGMGKSTMATLLCADGGALVTDDVLRLDGDSGRFVCRLGATELRLRKSAAELVEQFDVAPASRVTSDARDALRVAPSTTDRVPLAGIVFPLPDHERDTVEVTRLGAMEALITLLRFPRLLGWTDPAILDRQFQQAGEIVERVPVFIARVPWGPPFRPDLAPAIAAAVGVTAPAAPK